MTARHRIMVILGTRPEAVKLAPVIRALEAEPSFAVSVLATAQHREMLDQVLAIFGIAAEHDLNLMVANQTLAGLTSACLTGVEAILRQERPDLVLVQGDTTTVLASALATHYARIPLGHVEAGLRTADKFAPFPEEMNRRVATVLADLHFAPTSWAQGNLLAEGVRPETVFVTGNTVVDALEIVSRLPGGQEGTRRAVEAFLATRERFILVTAHRRESFGEGMVEICRAIKQIASAADGVGVVYPVHPNPNVSGPVRELLGCEAGVLLTDPLEYPAFVGLMKRCWLLLTDSGGVQEEGPTFGKPVLIMRDKTERPEGVAAGVARLVGTSSREIVAQVTRLLRCEADYAAMSRGGNPFGDGRAAARIVRVLRNHFEGRPLAEGVEAFGGPASAR